MPFQAQEGAGRPPRRPSARGGGTPSVRRVTTFASLSQQDLAVEPGLSVSVTVRVRNDGTVVDSFRVVPLGIPQDWVDCTPEQLSLLPGGEGVVDVTISPPRESDVAPGGRRFALKVCSTEDPAGSVVEEGALDVLPFTAPTAELQPRTSSARGRGVGRHRLAVDNRGNSPLEVRITGADRDGLLAVTAAPSALVVEPGTAVFVDLRVRPGKGFWRGPDRTIPFSVELAPVDGTSLPLDALLIHRARIPRWLPKALGALLLLAVLAMALWQGVLKPAVEDEARAAAAQEVAPLEDKVEDLAAAPPGAQPEGGPAPEPEPAPEPQPTAPPFVDEALGDPRDARLELRPGKQSAKASFGAAVFSLTDLVLSNPRGHEGLLTLKRGDEVLLQSDLANFRDLDYHFVSPLVFAPGQALRVGVECTTPTEGCEAAVFVSGYGKPAPAP